MPHEDKAAVQPHWATTRQRIGLCVAGIVGTVGFALIFEAIGSWGPWADAWIFTGSILATYGMNVIDCGVPVLCMHAPYEVIAKLDLFAAYRGFGAFYAMAE